MKYLWFLIVLIVVVSFSCKTVDGRLKLKSDEDHQEYDAIIVYDLSECLPAQFIVERTDSGENPYSKKIPGGFVVPLTVSRFKTIFHKTKPFAVIYVKGGYSYALSGILDYGYELRSIDALRNMSKVTVRAGDIVWGGKILFKSGVSGEYSIEIQKQPQRLDEVRQFVKDIGRK